MPQQLVIYLDKYCLKITNIEFNNSEQRILYSKIKFLL